MSQLLFSNNASTTLAGAISNVATTANLAAGSGVEFPTISGDEYFVATMVDATTGLINEIVHVTAITGDTVTMVRGQEGTTAVSWAAGDFFNNFWTAGQAAAMLQQGQQQSGVTNYSVDTGAVNAYVVALSPALTSYNNGLVIRFLTATANTLASTINAGAGAANILRADGSKLRANDIVAGLNELTYTNGAFRIPAAVGRTTIVSNLSLYINASTGNNTNDGLSTATAFQTVQGAINAIEQLYDLGGKLIGVNLADGTYSGGNLISAPWVGGAAESVTFNGNSGTPANVIISGNGCIEATGDGAGCAVQNMKLTSSGINSCLTANRNGQITIDQGIEFGTALSAAHIFVGAGANVTINNSYKISGGAEAHMQMLGACNLSMASGLTVTITGTPAWSGAFAVLSQAASVFFNATPTYTGSATGSRYSVTLNGVLNTNSGSTTALPGSTAGSTATGGQYN